MLISCLTGGAQQEPAAVPETQWDRFAYDLGSIFGGMGHAYSRPLHWKGEQWGVFGGILVGTSMAYLADEPISDFFIEMKEDVPRVIRDYGFEYGSPSNNYMFTGLVYMTGLFAKNEKLRRTGVLLISSASTAGLLQQILKSAVGRARPVAGLGKATFDPFWGGDSEFHSFPSGHAILAFTNAYAIGKQFRSPWVKAGIYTLGLVPGVSRLWEGKHWLSDVAFSVALSVVTVESIDRYLDRRYSEKYAARPQAVRWDLNLGPGQLGVVFSF